MPSHLNHHCVSDVEDTHNRLAFLDGGAILTLPLFYLEGMCLNALTSSFITSVWLFS